MAKKLTGNRERVLVYLRDTKPAPCAKQACHDLQLGRGYFARLLTELQDMGHIRLLGFQTRGKPIPVQFL